ncbi:hypothetical protein [Neobacillus sp. Marseille-QA0830]
MANKGMDVEKTAQDVSGISAVALGGMRVINLEQAFADYKKIMLEAVRRKDGGISGLPDDKLKGFVFEGHHKGTFNIDAAAKGLFKKDIQAHIGNDVLADGSVLSAHDMTTDILIESRPSLRQQLGQEQPNVKDYQAKVYESRTKTMRHLDQYDTNKLGPADQTPEYAQIEEQFRGRTVKSEPMTSDEAMDMVQNAKQSNVEYGAKQQRLNELRWVNFKTAVKAGAISGALGAAISEVADICLNGKDLTAKQFEESIVNVLKGTADGAGRGGVLFVAAELFGATGLKSVPGLAAANTLYDFAKDLYRFVNGKIDGDDLLCNTVTNMFTSTATFAGAQMGMSAAIGLGATIGTAVGPFGTLVGGAIGGLIAGLGASAVVTGAQKDAFRRVQQDIDEVMQSTTLNPRMKQLKLVEKMSSLSEIQFSFKDLIPMYNIIGDLAEYNQRKKVIKQVRKQVAETRGNLDREFEQAHERMVVMHERRCIELEDQFVSARRQLAQEYRGIFQQEIGGDFRRFTAAYSVAFGNLATSYSALEEAQNRHKQQLGMEMQRQEALDYYLNLVKEVSEESDHQALRQLVEKIQRVIRQDRFLKTLSYVDRHDILHYLREEEC